MNDLLQGAPYKDTACPHCNTLNFHPALVTKTDTVRDYSYNTNPTKPSDNKPLYSPLKIGDSFEVMKNKMEKIPSSSSYNSNTIAEEGIGEPDSPIKTLFPVSARDTPRGIAMNSSSGRSTNASSGSAERVGVHRAAASLFVKNIFASQGQDVELHSSGININNTVSNAAAEFVFNIFNPPTSRSDDGRRHSKSKVTPLNFNDDSFDSISIDGSNSHRDNSGRQVMAQ